MTVNSGTKMNTLKDNIVLNDDQTSQVNISSQPILIHTGSSYSDDVLTRSFDQPRNSATFPLQKKEKSP